MIPANVFPITKISNENIITNTYKVDKKRGRIVGTVNGMKAMEQAILKNLETERYSYVIYSPNYGMELVKYIGKDFDYVRADFQRALEECLLVDSRVQAINNLNIKQTGLDSLTIDFDVITVEGVLHIVQEVKK